MGDERALLNQTFGIVFGHPKHKCKKATLDHFRPMTAAIKKNKQAK